ncbi:sensor histidine kinase [Paeniglutamicibacter psychrophenolicus]|uniref:sensor histidine kinase n=1 Tax=Paeniglutamicibacter psychrophenolicus TaxID=257454 RepID=UPI002784446F|nr:histidine kinase [Paeniglutamicibacter psychrophenolicus]MDQ0095885.1 signal transduction histidine kinase [Paeniglutamicibacter psychrophenolicus]
MLADDNATATPGPGRRGRVRPQDLALALGYAGVAWLLHALAMNNDGAWGLHRYNEWWPLPLAIGCLAVALRQRHVLAASATMAVAGIVLLPVGSSGGFFLVFESVFTLVLWGGARVSRAAEHGSLVLTALLTIVMYFVTGSAAISVTLALVAAMVLVMPAQWAGNIRHARELAASEARTAAAMAEAAEARSAAQAAEHERLLVAERTTMAREVHDVLSARLAAIALQSGAALNSPQNPQLAARAMDAIRTQSVNGIEELSTMIRMLHRGTPLAPAGSLGDVPALVQAYSGSGLRVAYRNELPAGGSALDAVTQATIYRSVNESLVNFAKHAPDGELALSLVPRDGSVLFSASNPAAAGHPGDGGAAGVHGTGTGTGTGLQGMRARSAELGGSFRISTANNTFAVFMLLPMGHRPPAAAAAPGKADLPLGHAPAHLNEGST